MSLLLRNRAMISEPTGGPPTNGLIHYYPFNGNTNDESGNGYNLTNVGSTLTTDRKAASDSAYQFNGTSNLMHGVYNPSHITLEFSVNWWIKFDTTTLDRVMIVIRESTGFATLYLAKQSDAQFRIFISNEGGGFDDSNVVVNIDTVNWFLFSLNVQHSGGDINIELFKNTVSIYNITTPFILSNGKILRPNADELLISSLFTSGLRFHSGKQDDIRIYNRVLTDEEITQLYNE